MMLKTGKQFVAAGIEQRGPVRLIAEVNENFAGQNHHGKNEEQHGGLNQCGFHIGV